MNRRQCDLFCNRLVALDRCITAEPIDYKENEDLIVIEYKGNMFTYCSDGLRSVMYENERKQDEEFRNRCFSIVSSYVRKAYNMNVLKW